MHFLLLTLNTKYTGFYGTTLNTNTEVPLPLTSLTLDRLFHIVVIPIFIKTNYK